MITYKLNFEGLFALKIIDGVSTGEWHNVQTNEEYLRWVEAGNTPEPVEE